MRRMRKQETKEDSRHAEAKPSRPSVDEVA
jgi:hypothetical protein